MKYYFIINPNSRTGSGLSLWEELEKKIVASKLQYEAFFTEGTGSATGIAEKICNEHPESKRIVIVGGDGTINEAVNGLHDYAKISLGIIPTGSGNDLARGLGISESYNKALAHAIHPSEFIKVDHGCLEYLDDGSASRRFAVSAGIGYDADICWQAQKSPLKKILNRFGLGSSIYYLIGIKQIFTNKRASITLNVDGKRKIKYDKVIFIAAMNTLYEGGGIPMAPGADPSDGKLSLCVANNISRFRHCLLMTKARKGEHVKFKGIEIITCRSAEIEADRPLVLHTDGEFAGKHRHIKLSCVPEQIRMMI